MVQRPLKIVILGAGIAGLSLAWHLEQNTKEPIEIVLIDQNPYVGGMIHTEVFQKNFFEVGPHTLRLAYPYKETCLELIDKLGLNEDLIYPSDEAKRRYIGYEGKLNPFPMNPLKLLTPFHLKNIVWPLLKESSQEKLKDEDPSIYDFLPLATIPISPTLSLIRWFQVFGEEISNVSL